MILPPFLQQSSLLAQALGVSRRYSAPLFLPNSGYVFSDSAGTTPAVQDGPVGRINDYAGSGVYVSQSTSGYRPTWRWGALNRLLNSVWAGGTSGTEGSGAVAPTGWSFGASTGSVTYSGVTIRFQATSQQPFLSGYVTPTLGVSYTASARIDTNGSSAPINSMIAVAGSGGTVGPVTFAINGVAASATDVPASGSIVSATATCTGAGGIAVRMGLGCVGSTTGDVTMSRPQLEVGSVASTYVATTNAPASNGIGPKWMDFDGAQTRLILSTLPFGNSDDAFVASAIRYVSYGNLTVFSLIPSGSARWQTYVNNNGNHTFSVVDDTGTGMASIVAAGFGPGVNGVSSLTRQGTTQKLRSNGVQIGTSTYTSGTATFTGAEIGCNLAGSNFFSGAIYGLTVGKATISAPDLYTLEKYLASLPGVTIA